MVKGQTSDKDRKGKAFRIIRNFSGNLAVEDYVDKMVKAHLEKSIRKSYEETKIGR